MGILFLIHTHFFRNTTRVEGNGIVYSIEFESLLVYLWRLATKSIPPNQRHNSKC